MAIEGLLSAESEAVDQRPQLRITLVRSLVCARRLLRASVHFPLSRSRCYILTCFFGNSGYSAAGAILSSCDDSHAIFAPAPNSITASLLSPPATGRSAAIDETLQQLFLSKWLDRTMGLRSRRRSAL